MTCWEHLKKKHDKKILQVEFKTIILPTRRLMSRVLITQHVHIVKFFYFSSNSCISLKILYLPFTCYSIFDTSGGGGGSIRDGGREIHVNSPSTFLWKLPLKKPKFKDVCVPFKHSHFCSRILGMHSSKRLRF